MSSRLSFLELPGAALSKATGSLNWLILSSRLTKLAVLCNRLAELAEAGMELA